MTPPRPLRALVLLLALGLAFGLGLALGMGWPAGRGEARDAAAPADGETIWTCSMHPQIRSPDPGLCPLCAMELIPVSSLGDGAPVASGEGILLSPRARALLRLRTEPARRGPGEAAVLRLQGQLELPPDARSELSVAVAGRVEALHLADAGEPVRAGQPFVTLDSPELFAAQGELWAARAQLDRQADAPPEVRALAEATVAAARERLRRLGLDEAALAEVEAGSEPRRAVRLRAPRAGILLARRVSPGAWVEPGAALYELGRLDRLWLQLLAFEDQLDVLRPGLPVHVELPALPDLRLDGRIERIEPVLDAERRVARLRVPLDNPDGRLRPGLAAVGQVAVAAEGEALWIPDTAPLTAGARALVYVERMEGEAARYEPRTVRLGRRAGGRVEVLAGLAEGEAVVVAGAFALDADLQLRGGPSLLAEDEPAPAGTPAPGAGLGVEVIAHYLDVQRALAEDDAPGAQRAARALAAASEDPTLRLAASALAAEAGLDGQRAAFQPLSERILAGLREGGNPTDEELHLARCPMVPGAPVEGKAGARWIQAGRSVDNAYYGASMRRCGELEESFPPRGAAP